jgi:hypothetical protein
MKPPEKGPPGRSGETKSDRERRLAAALRANLRRRKASQRPPPTPVKPPGEDT